MSRKVPKRMQTLTVDREQQYQTWDVGLEVTPNVAQPAKPWWPAVRDEAVRRVVALGVNQVRLEANGKEIAGAGGFDPEWLETQIERYLIPLETELQSVKGRRLRVNICNVAFSSALDAAYPWPNLLNPADAARYGAYAVDCVEYTEGRGFTVDSWEICLEPDNSKTTVFKGADKMAAAILAARAALDAAGLARVAIMAPSCVSTATAVAYVSSWATNNPAALDAVDILSYHRYSSASITEVTQMGQHAKTHGKRAAMTELMSYDPDKLYQDIVAGHNSGFQRFGIAGKNTDPRYQPAPWFWITEAADQQTATIADHIHTARFRQYTAHIEPGAVRVGTSAAPNPQSATAWVNPDGKLVVVLHNAGVASTLAGIEPGDYEVSAAQGSPVQNVTIGIYTVAGTTLPVPAVTPGPVTVRQL
jgi:hypothetical protein